MNDFVPLTNVEPYDSIPMGPNQAFVLPENVGLKLGPNRRLLEVVRFRTDNNNVIRKFWDTGAHNNHIVVNYWRPPRVRTPAVDITTLFPTPGDARQFLENTLRAYMESAIADETIPQLPELFEDDRCRLFPGTEDNSDYIALRFKHSSKNKQVQLSHLARYAYAGDWLYRRDEHGDYVYRNGAHFDASATDCSHRCHHRTCFNYRHLVFEPRNANLHRCSVDTEVCTCTVQPPCILGHECVRFNYFSYDINAPWPCGRAYMYTLKANGGSRVIVLPPNQIGPGEPINGIPDSQYYIENNTNQA